MPAAVASNFALQRTVVRGARPGRRARAVAASADYGLHWRPTWYMEKTSREAFSGPAPPAAEPERRTAEVNNMETAAGLGDKPGSQP
jgi:hypothetical protein